MIRANVFLCCVLVFAIACAKQVQPAVPQRELDVSSSAEVEPPPDPVDPPRIVARLELIPGAEGRVRIVGAVSFDVPVHAGEALVLDAVGFEQVRVSAPDGVAWSYDGASLTLEHGQIDVPGGRSRFDVSYEVTPDAGVIVTPDAVWSAFSTWRWLPVKGDPSWRVLTELEIQAPDGWVTLATGDGPEHPGADVASHIPHPAYTLGFFVGRVDAPSRRRDGFSVWGLSESDADRVLDHTARAHERLRDAFGQAWPAREGYVQVFVPGRAMQELAGMAFMSEGYASTILNDSSEDWLIVHELAHQRWGNRVTCRSWGDFWINEAVVTWWVARDKARRGDSEGFEREVKLWRRRLDRRLERGGDARIWRPGVGVDHAGGAVVYHGGALVVEQLARHLGPEVLEARLGVWMLDAMKAGRSVDTLELIASLELEPEFERAILCQLEDASAQCGLPELFPDGA